MKMKCYGKQLSNLMSLPWINTREDDPKDPKNALLFNVKTLLPITCLIKKVKLLHQTFMGKNFN